MAYPARQFDTEPFLQDPLMVATSCSWRRILHQSGSPVCLPTNHGKRHYPTLDITDEMATLFAATPYLMVATSLLLSLTQKTLSGKPKSSESQPIIEFAKQSLVFACNNDEPPESHPEAEHLNCRITSPLIVDKGDGETIGLHFRLANNLIAAQGCNHPVDHHPDIVAADGVLDAFSAAPEFYEAIFWLLDTQEKLFHNHPVKDADEAIVFAEKALEKARFNIFNYPH